MKQYIEAPVIRLKRDLNSVICNYTFFNDFQLINFTIVPLTINNFKYVSPHKIKSKLKNSVLFYITILLITLTAD